MVGLNNQVIRFICVASHLKIAEKKKSLFDYFNIKWILKCKKNFQKNCASNENVTLKQQIKRKQFKNPHRKIKKNYNQKNKRRKKESRIFELNETTIWHRNQ